MPARPTRAAGRFCGAPCSGHLFGSVINLSAVMILGDRQSRRAPMTPLQAAVLSRFRAGLALVAVFAAMGIALSNAPGAQLVTPVERRPAAGGGRPAAGRLAAVALAGRAGVRRLPDAFLAHCGFRVCWRPW